MVRRGAQRDDRRGRAATIAVALALLLALAAVVKGDSLAPVLVSTVAPLPQNCETGPRTGRPYRSSAVEPRLAANPLDPTHLAGVWQQDRWSDGGATGQRAAVSRDGGATWTLTTMPYTKCGGGTPDNAGNWERGSDPWVSFGPDGALYQSALVFNRSDKTRGLLVAPSRDGGASWERPSLVTRREEAGGLLDKPSITADPARPGAVYAVWSRTGNGADSHVEFARTTDGGRSWTAARSIHNAGASEALGSQIVALPGGALLHVFAETRFERTGGPGSAPRQVARVGAMRSDDGGDSWSAPLWVAPLLSQGTQDPVTRQPIRTGPLPEAAVDPVSGTVYAVWADARFEDAPFVDGVVLTASADGGRTWTEPVRVNRTPAGVTAFVPSLYVLPDGTVGVAYYDLRGRSRDTGNAVAADYWVATCRQGCLDGVNWREHHVAGPFDLGSTPFSRGFFVGDYQGLAGAGGRFVHLFVQGDTGLTPNPADVYFAATDPAAPDE